MTIPVAFRANAFLNAITFDTFGRIYVSDSTNGIIWTATLALTNGISVEATVWIDRKLDPDGLLSPPAAGGRLFPTVGANGIAFSNSGGRMLVANTGFRNIIQIPVTGGTTPVPDPANPPSIFVTGINGPDGIAVQKTGTGAGRIWVAANQSNEIVVIDNLTGRVITKLGDFDGLQGQPGARHPNGLLFPASLAFSNTEHELYVSNAAFGQGPPPAIDTAWTEAVTAWNVAKIATSAVNRAPNFP
jgi:hypothetical protein